MAVKPAVFQSGGQISEHYIPGAYSRLDFIKGSGGLVSTNRAVIFGNSGGGEPGKVLWFTGATEAAETLRSGPLLDAIKHAFVPGGGLVPQAIGAYRVNTAIQASSDFKQTSTVIITAKSWDYGLHVNQLKRKLEAATTSGKKLSVQYQANEVWVRDNIEKESLEIQYTGAAASATMTINATQLSTSCAATPADDLTILFSAYATIEDLVNYINDQTAYTCTIKATLKTDPSNELDVVTAQDI